MRLISTNVEHLETLRNADLNVRTAENDTLLVIFVERKNAMFMSKYAPRDLPIKSKKSVY